MAPHATWWIDGVPTSYSAGAAEAAWKSRLADVIPEAEGRQARRGGVLLDFVLPAGGNRAGPDIDNLCEPVLSVLVNRRAWFSGKRNRVSSLIVRKHLGSAPGCRVSVADELVLHGDSIGKPHFRAAFPGPLPTSARDPALANWLRAQVALDAAAPFAVAIAFNSVRVNLGDIASGPAKSVLDGLWPLIGGEPGAPADHLITVLSLSKPPEQSAAPQPGATISVWERADSAHLVPTLSTA